jgi:hypothetical protein
VAFPSGVHVFPVRHHSPRTTHVLRRFLDDVKPALVLIEGPCDADPLIEVVLDPETVPPVAILGYRTDGTPGSVLYPFATYSPEYAALAWAKERGVPARFCDMSIGQSLAYDRRAPEEARDDESIEEDEHAGEEPVEPAGEAIERPPRLEEQAARAHGFRSFEELWEAWFEAPAYDPDGFRDALIAYAEIVRAQGGPILHRARDALITRKTREAIEAGTPANRIALVVGAAHAAAFAAGDVDPTLEDLLVGSVACASTLIPYSFPRLAEQTGYGAGNRAPRYYQRAHDADCSFRRATLEVLIDFAEHLRLRGFSASLADVIEAYRLACMLAQIRGKTEPGLDEVREATIATLCRGEAQHVDGLLWSTVIGKSVGKVASRVGKNSLQEEFWREIEERRLPRSDEPESFVLKLNDPVQVETSVFLHRLRIADVPYATYSGAQTGPSMRAADEPGGHAALARVRENWQAQWTPSTDVALVERIVLGETLSEVVTRVLEERLRAVTTTGGAADVLLEAVVTGVPRVIPEALLACDRFASTDDDIASLARACRALSGLVSYGTSRAKSSIGDDAIPELASKTFARAVLRLRPSCIGDDEAVRAALEAMRILHEIALAFPIVDAEAWFQESSSLARDFVVHGACAGMATGLLYLAEKLGEEDVALVVQQRLSDVTAPEPAAQFLSGFFEVNAIVLVKSRPVVAALDAFLVGIDRDRFKDTLPLLRRAFGALGATERRYLLENLLAIRKIGAHAKEAAQVLAAKDVEQLKEINEDLGKVMDDLDDLL